MDRQRQAILANGAQAGVGAAALALHASTPAIAGPERGGEVFDSANGAPDDGRHDFDFLYGHWQLRNERLQRRLVGCEDWEIFSATQECGPILDGLGNLDEFVTDWSRSADGAPLRGMTLRLFNPATRQWSLYWASNVDGLLEPPVVGAFETGPDGGIIGTFVGHAEHDGRPVLVRFIWDQISANAAHWQQAFSDDDGQSWETNWHMWLRRVDASGRLRHDDAVIELRQYTLQPGQRDALIALFEREFIETQEAVGIHVIGQFRDLDAADRYVWLRGFPSMPARAAALQAFYGGPVWQRHREAANATLLDNDDVLLLKPARPGSGFAPAECARADGAASLAGIVCAGICSLAVPADRGFVAWFERTLAPLLRESGAQLLATYVTDASANTFPRLPVREGEHVLVWFARFADEPALRRHDAALAGEPRWREALAEALDGDLKQPPQRLRLSPTPRSELR